MFLSDLLSRLHIARRRPEKNENQPRRNEETKKEKKKLRALRFFVVDFLSRLRVKKTRPSHLALGEYGERLVAEYLKRQGYRIVAANFIAPIGHGRDGRQITGEIDIVAYDESTRPFTLAFIEVKTRSSDEIAQPETAVDLRKQRQIIRAARVYRRITDVLEEPHRYDVASVVVKPGVAPSVTLRRGYFSEQRFSRSQWRRRDI